MKNLILFYFLHFQFSMKKLLLIISIFYSFSSLAQSQVEVNVIDLLTNKPVKSVEVYLETYGEKTIFGLSDKAGKVVFKDLQTTKTYKAFTFANDKYAEAFVGSITPKSGETGVFTLELPTIRVELLEEVRITNSKRAKMNTQNAEVSYIIPKEEIQALPVEGRDITRTLIRLPNLTVATLGYAEAPNVSDKWPWWHFYKLPHRWHGQQRAFSWKCKIQYTNRFCGWYFGSNQ